MEEVYDENLLSRQLGVYGKETMGKLANMKVLIIGMRGIGAGKLDKHLYCLILLNRSSKESNIGRSKKSRYI
jgi:tRNA A37 threonylcarbamoyladenosine dehydratase